MKTKTMYNVDLRSRKTGESVLTLLKTGNYSEAWDLVDKTNQAWFQNIGVYSSSTPTDSWIDGSEGYFADVIETEEEILIPKINRLELLCKALNGYNYLPNRYFDFYMGKTGEFVGTMKQDVDGKIYLEQGISYYDTDGSEICVIKD